MATLSELTGTLKVIKWRADDGSAIIAALSGGHTVKGQVDPDDEPEPGLTYRFHGRYERHERYGEQFVFSTYSKLPPADRRGVCQYLVKVAPNVGEATARRLWEAFGGDAMRVLREEPSRVSDAGVMSHDAAVEASNELQKESAFESVKVELIGLFAGRGFQVGPVIRDAIRLWGAKAPEAIRRNPYVLMLKQLPSCGFKRCDKLYLDLGGKPGRLKRQILLCEHTLKTDNSGHTWHLASRVGDKIVEAIPGADPVRALRAGLRAKRLQRLRVGGELYIAEAKKGHNESTLAREILSLIKERPKHGAQRTAASASDGRPGVPREYRGGGPAA